MYRWFRPLLFSLSAERAHKLTFALLRGSGALGRSLGAVTYGAPDPRLRLRVAGLEWNGPVGLAAGLDKDGVLTRFWPNLGFGAIELGTVTAHAQPGNPEPRLFRFPEHRALINRMGFNNHGSQALAERLTRLKASARRVPIGVNLGKSKITPLDDAVTDYAQSAERVGELGDYLVINVSSPNTPGLRKLQDASFLKDILQAVRETTPEKPLYIKVAPDLGEGGLDDVIQVAESGGADGLIATNTTIDHQGIGDVGAGGLSGAPLKKRSREVVRYVVPRTRLPVIAVGGMDCADDVLDALAHGASGVQIYSALIFHGPGLIHRINKDILSFLDQVGASDLSTLLATPSSSWWADK